MPFVMRVCSAFASRSATAARWPSTERLGSSRASTPTSVAASRRSTSIATSSTPTSFCAFGLGVSRRLVCGQGARRPRNQVVPRLDELTLDVRRLEPLAHQRITLRHALPPRTLELSVELGDRFARAPLGLDRGGVRLTCRVGRRARRPRLGELRRQHLGIGLALHPLLERGALPDERLACATRRSDGVLGLRHPIPSARLGLAGGLERLPRPVRLTGCAPWASS